MDNVENNEFVFGKQYQDKTRVACIREMSVSSDLMSQRSFVSSDVFISDCSVMICDDESRSIKTIALHRS